MTLRDILLSSRHILFPIFLGLPPAACNVTGLLGGGPSLTCTVPSLKSRSAARSDTRKRSRQRLGAAGQVAVDRPPSCGQTQPRGLRAEGSHRLAHPPAPPSPHLSQPPLHVSGKEPKDGQLGAQQAGHIPQGERLQLSPLGHVDDLADGGGGLHRAVPAVRTSVPGTSHPRTPSHAATSLGP